jgi:hypothetical protein
MDTTFIPGPQDSKLQMDTATTIAATGPGGVLDNGLNYGPGTIGQPICAVVNPTALKTSATNETYSAVLQESSDNATWTACGPAVSFTGVVNGSVPGFLSKRYVRLFWTLGGTSPTLTYSAWLNPNGFAVL